MKKLLLAVGVIVAVLLAGCSGKKSEKPKSVETFTVKKVDLKDIVSQTGQVNSVNKVDIKYEASGKIEKVYVKEGQSINKGDTILYIDPYRLNTQKQKLELSVREAQIEYRKSQRDFGDGTELHASGSVSARKLFDLDMKQQLDSINLLRQKLELLDIKDQLSKTVIISPITGVLTKLSVEEGEIAVSATTGFQSGTEIATVADISNLEVIATIGEVDYIHINKGAPVVIKPEANENSRTKGTVTFIALSARKNQNDELSGFEVRVSIDSLIPGIAPGINVNVVFTIKEMPGVLGVPYNYVEKVDTLYFVNKMGIYA
ncbi:MAG TPA: efflux RND transporter periplasmic adaptor subunit, partial [Chitinispirillaceae bacterium]|nr:efflux RND transporter periplasmic adaptor subunit [Chitinispirillaceae bacterium]